MTTPAEYTWKSIELAPKDGTAVMVLVRDAVTTAVYCHQFKCWDLVVVGDYASNGFLYDPAPTAFCPIPPPPKDLA